MQQHEAAAAIFARWMQLWTPLHPTIPFAFDNDDAPEAPIFARVGLLSIDSDQWTLGPEGHRLWRRPGYIDVRITAPSDKGRKATDLLVNDVRKIYEGKRFASKLGDDGIVTHACSISELKRDRDGPQLWVVQCLTPFEFWESR